MAEPHSTQRPQNPRCESLEVAFRLPPGSLQVASLEVLQTCLTGCVLTSKHQHCHHRQCKRPQLYATSFKVNETLCALTVQAVFRSFNLPAPEQTQSLSVRRHVAQPSQRHGGSQCEPLSLEQKPNRGFYLVADIRNGENHWIGSQWPDHRRCRQNWLWRGVLGKARKEKQSQAMP